MWIANISQRYFLNIETGTMLIVGPTGVKFVKEFGENSDWQTVARIKDREKEPEEIFNRLLAEFYNRGALLMVFRDAEKEKRKRNLEELENKLANVAFTFRHADEIFPHLDVDYKNLLNVAGKVLDDVVALLRSYRWAGDEEERRKIFRQLYNMYCAVRTKKEEE